MDSHQEPAAQTPESASAERGYWYGILALVLIANLMLVSPRLMQPFNEINAFDEAKYIESGRLLLQGELRNLAWGPVVSLLYAGLHLVLGNSPDWFLLESWVSRFLLYSLLWVGTFVFARRLDSKTAAVVVGVLFVSTVPLSVIANQSDGLFIFFSAIGLAKMLDYLTRRRQWDLVLSSLLVGLSVLSRFEGVLLIPLLLVVPLLVRATRPPRLRHLAAGLAPALLIVVGYMGIFKAVHPDLDHGIGGKSYTAFENHYPLPGVTRQSERAAVTRRYFGTSAENNGSVLVALARHPGGTLRRIRDQALVTPSLFLDAFGKQLGPATALLALLGAYSLIRQKRYAHLALITAWSAPSLVSILFVARHLFLQTHFMFLSLAALGIVRFVDTARGRERVAFSLIAIGSAIAGLATDKLAVLASGLVLGLALILIDVVSRLGQEPEYRRLAAAGSLMATGLFFRTPFAFPNYAPRTPLPPSEAVVRYLQSLERENMRVLENLPLPALAAKMSEIAWNQVPDSIVTAPEFHSWLVEHDVVAMHVGGAGIDPRLERIIEEGLDRQFELGFVSEDQSKRVYRVLESPGD